MPKKSSSWRRWRPLMGAALVVVIVGVGVAVVQRRQTPSTLVAGAAQYPAGWQALPQPPITDRSGPSVIWSGREVFLIGGSSPTKNFDAVDHRTDGAAFDPATGRWRKLAAMPVRLWGLGSVWTGSQVVVLGIRCDTQDDEGNCSPGGYASAVLDQNGRWQAVLVPDSLQPEYRPNPPGPEEVGWTGTEAVFTLGRNNFAAFDPVAAAWRPLPAPPGRIRESCVAGTTLVALTSKWSRDGVVFEDDPRGRGERGDSHQGANPPRDAYVQARLAVFEGGQWRESVPAPGVESENGFRLRCTSDFAAVVGGSLRGADIVSYVLAERRWQPSDGRARSAVSEAAVNFVAVGDELLAWDDRRGEGAAANLRAGTTRSFPAGPEVGDGFAVDASNRRFFVYIGTPDWSERTRFYVYTAPADGEDEASFPGGQH
jgi:hypothetical protein